MLPSQNLLPEMPSKLFYYLGSKCSYSPAYRMSSIVLIFDQRIVRPIQLCLKALVWFSEGCSICSWLQLRQGAAVQVIAIYTNPSLTFRSKLFYPLEVSIFPALRTKVAFLLNSQIIIIEQAT